MLLFHCRVAVYVSGVGMIRLSVDFGDDDGAFGVKTYDDVWLSGVKKQRNHKSG